MRNFVTLITVFILTITISSFSYAQDQKKQTIVVHIKHFTDNLHAVAMGLKLATGLQDKGANAPLVLTLDGVRLMDKGQTLDLKWGAGKAISELLDAYIKSGGKIWVCPHCAKAAGMDEKRLRKGATIATGKTTIPDILLEADKILDY